MNPLHGQWERLRALAPMQFLFVFVALVLLSYAIPWLIKWLAVIAVIVAVLVGVGFVALRWPFPSSVVACIAVGAAAVAFAMGGFQSPATTSRDYVTPVEQGQMSEREAWKFAVGALARGNVRGCGEVYVTSSGQNAYSRWATVQCYDGHTHRVHQIVDGKVVPSN